MTDEERKKKIEEIVSHLADKFTVILDDFHNRMNKSIEREIRVAREYIHLELSKLE